MTTGSKFKMITPQEAIDAIETANVMKMDDEIKKAASIGQNFIVITQEEAITLISMGIAALITGGESYDPSLFYLRKILSGSVKLFWYREKSYKNAVVDLMKYGLTRE